MLGPSGSDLLERGETPLGECVRCHGRGSIMATDEAFGVMRCPYCRGTGVDETAGPFEGDNEVESTSGWGPFEKSDECEVS